MVMLDIRPDVITEIIRQALLLPDGHSHARMGIEIMEHLANPFASVWELCRTLKAVSRLLVIT
jgi:hypothetical protein